MIDGAALFLFKAIESLAGADSEFASRRYNNSASRAYYACFQAAIAALMLEGIQPPGEQWSHEAMPGSFDGILINRRKLYSSEIRGVLDRNHILR